MPSNNNNSGWKKKSGSETIYETTLSFNKYDDPNNPIDKKKGIVISRFNVVDGEIQLFEKKGSTETLMSTIKADGSQRFDSGNLDAVTRNDALLTSSPIAIPGGGVTVTLYWLALAPPPIKFALKSSMAAIVILLPH